MSILPNSLNGQIQFCETHAPVWAASPAGVGLTAPQLVILTELTNDARGAFESANAAREASKAATITLRSEVDEMRDYAADLIRQIKAFAELQEDPAAVYAAAQLPLPLPPAPLEAPGKPTDFAVQLNSDGSVTLSWSAANSSASTGAFFTVQRKLPGQAFFTPLGGAPGSTSETRRPSFTDSTVPASAAGQGAQYIVQGFRGTRTGVASDAYVVQFGIDSGGGLTSASIKMAA
jgi:hypothetical protein